MPTQVRSKLPLIAPTIKTHLVESLGLDPAHVLWRGRKQPLSDWPVLPRWFIALTIHGPKPYEWQYAAGRYNTGVLRPLEVAIISQLGLDQPDRDDNALLHETDGLWVREDQVLDALQEFWPEDGNGNVLTVCPLWLLPSEAVPDDAKPPPDHHEVKLVFALNYNWDFSVLDTVNVSEQ